MIAADILKTFRQKVCHEIEIESEGLDRYIVHTPFAFEDGDHFVVVLRKENADWVLTDEGHTFLHLSYSDVNFATGGRARMIEQALASHHVANAGGELRLTVPNQSFGDALFSYLQALARIATVTQWTRDRVRSTFREDVQGLITSVVPAERVTFGFIDPEIDPDGNYQIDCVVDPGKNPLFLFAIGNNDQCREATIKIYHFERHERHFRSAAIFEDQTRINRRAVAQLTDVVGRQFASLAARDRIRSYLTHELTGSHA